MRAFLDNQTSGNDWGVPFRAMLHENLQESPKPVELPAVQHDSLRDIENQMTQFEREYQAAVATVRKIYVFPSDDSATDFLTFHRALPQLLIDAAPHITSFFPENVISLRASSDEYGSTILYADVLWPGDAREALTRLDSFEDAWWIANSRPARGTLIFTYRLV
jgi:hypothetical protein